MAATVERPVSVVSSKFGLEGFHESLTLKLDYTGCSRTGE